MSHRIHAHTHAPERGYHSTRTSTRIWTRTLHARMLGHERGKRKHKRSTGRAARRQEGLDAKLVINVALHTHTHTHSERGERGAKRREDMWPVSTYVAHTCAPLSVRYTPAVTLQQKQRPITDDYISRCECDATGSILHRASSERIVEKDGAFQLIALRQAGRREL